MTQRCLLIGTGSIGRRHASALRNLLPDARILAFRQLGREALPVDVADAQTSHWDEALAWAPTMAIVANPAPLHADSTIPLLQAGLPVLLEKPPVTDAPAGARLLAAAHENPRLLVGYVLRHNPALAVFREALLSGRIGRVVSLHLEAGQALANWRPGTDPHASISARAETGGGVLFELSHEIDMARWLGGDASVIHATAARGDPDMAVEDAAGIVMRNHSGTLITIQIDMARQPSCRRYFAAGTLGTLLWDAADGNVCLETGAGNVALHAGNNDRNDMFSRQMAHFLDVARGDAEPVCTLADALRSLDLVLAARQSAGLAATGTA